MSTPDNPLNSSTAPETQDGEDQTTRETAADQAAPSEGDPAVPTETDRASDPDRESSEPPAAVPTPFDAGQAGNAAPAGFQAANPQDAARAEDETQPGHRPAPGPSDDAGEATPPSVDPAPVDHAAATLSEPTPTLAAPETTETVVTNTGAGESGASAAEPDAAAEGEPHVAEATPVTASDAPEEGAGAETGPEAPAEAGAEMARPADESGESADEIPGGAFDGQAALDFDRTWQRIEEAFETKTPVTALVIDRVKGGLIVDIGMQGFVPASHVASGKIHDLERYIGRTLKLRITDLDRERQRVVLSSRLVQEEEHARKRKETLEKLKVGMITDGVVRRLTEFGAFVDIGGIDGLLHVSEMSWSRVTHPKEVVSPGDKIKVKVLKVSDDRKKISLGMRQLLPDPWNGIERQFKVGDIVDGRVVRIAPFGAFVQVKDGVEAILPNSEVTARKAKPEELPQVGDSIHAKIIELRPDARRMGLSVRRVQEDQDRREYQQHQQTQQTQQSNSRTTIGDLFGDMLSEWSEDKDKQEDEG